MQMSEGATPTIAVLPDFGVNDVKDNGRVLVTKDFMAIKHALHGSTRSSDGQMEAVFHYSHLELQECKQNHIAIYAEMMGDIMCYHQAIPQHNEVEDHVKNNHWKLVKRDQVTPDTDILPKIWAMCRKQNLMTNGIKSHMDRLSMNSRKQVYGAT